LGLSKDKLHSEAANRLQGELAKEGRAASSSVALPAKAAAGATTSTKRSGSRKGAYYFYLSSFSKFLLQLAVTNWI
jgi:hypothetical protein